MQKNIHPIERTMRVLVGAVVASLAFWGPSNLWFLVGLVPVMTGLTGWCPPYQIFGINTCKLGKKAQGLNVKEMWNERFGMSDYFYGTDPNVYLECSVKKFKPAGSILCIGEGEGRNAVYLESQGFKVTAVDFSERGKTKALALAEMKNVTLDYKVADLSTFDFGVERWDAVISVFCHLPPTTRASVHTRIKSSLKPGGIFLLESYNPEQLALATGGPKDLSMLYTSQMMQEDFLGLDWLELKNEMTELHEGQGHRGESSVLRGIAQKNEKEYL